MHISLGRLCSKIVCARSPRMSSCDQAKGWGPEAQMILFENRFAHQWVAHDGADCAASGLLCI